MDAPFFAMVFLGVVSAIGAGALIKRQFSVKHYTYSSPRVKILPEGGDGSCSGGMCTPSRENTITAGLDAYRESRAARSFQDAETQGDGTNYRVLRTSEIELGSREPEAIPVPNWPVRKDAD